MNVLDPTNPIYAVGTDQDRDRARAEWRRERFAAQLNASNLERLDHADLTKPRFGITEHLPTGRLYKVRPDALVDLDFAGAAVAYFAHPDGRVVLLEPPTGPQSRQVAEEQQADRERRRSAKKEKPAWMNS